MLTLVALIMGTFLVLSIVPITVGQTLVRRKQAQMIVDAAALAGAQQQAKALNTIARINEKALNLVNAINWAQWLTVYFDSEDRTWERIFWIGITNDWVKDDMWDSYTDAFSTLNSAIGRCTGLIVW